MPTARYRAEPRFLELGDGFFDPVSPARFPRHQLRFRNQRAAATVGLDELDADGWERAFARFEPLPDNLPQPLALRYHGHQFMVYNPNLGDGRGFLYAQLRATDGRLLDLSTKGSGQTPWSRGGDGRLTLQGGVREVLASELLEALGVPTCRTIALFETGEPLFRSDEPSPARSAVLTRLMHSSLRFGTFQRHAREGSRERLSSLVDHAIAHYLPEARAAEEHRVAALYRSVVERTASLAAAWGVAGFVHGVLNTDNMNLTGESFDYGPWRFLPTYQPDFVAAYFDASGIYAFGRQPRALLWNLMQLAEALHVLAPEVPYPAILDGYQHAFGRAMRARLCARLGAAESTEPLDDALVDATFAFLDESQVPFERFFYDWYGGDAARAQASPEAARYAGDRFLVFRRALEARPSRRPPQLAHPYFSDGAPCTLVDPEYRALWRAIAEHDDLGPFERKLAAIRRMGEALAPASAERTARS